MTVHTRCSGRLSCVKTSHGNVLFDRSALSSVPITRHDRPPRPAIVMIGSVNGRQCFSSNTLPAGRVVRTCPGRQDCRNIPPLVLTGRVWTGISAFSGRAVVKTGGVSPALVTTSVSNCAFYVICMYVDVRMLCDHGLCRITSRSTIVGLNAVTSSKAAVSTYRFSVNCRVQLGRVPCASSTVLLLLLLMSLWCRAWRTYGSDSRLFHCDRSRFSKSTTPSQNSSYMSTSDVYCHRCRCDRVVP